MALADSFGAGVNAINDMYRGQALRDQLQTYPDLLQAQLQQAQHTAGLSGVTLQYAPQMAAADLQKSNLFNQYYGPSQQANIGLTNAQAGQASANAGYIGTEAQKNQFLINNPGLMVPGIGGQIAGIGYLQQHDPSMFQGAPDSAPAPAQVNTPAPIAAPFNPNGITGLGGTPFSAQPPISPQSIQNQGGQFPPVSSPNIPQTTGLGGPMMFGGNPLANRLLQSLFAPMNKNLAQTQYYNAKTAQILPQVDPTTGQMTSVNTTPNTTLDQRTIAAIQRVNPLLNSLSSNLSQFQTAVGEGKLKLSQAGNYLFGQNNPAANQYAQGQADLKTAPESLLKAWGLNVTNESLERMQEAVEPIYGESPQGYHNRIVNTLQTLQSNEDQAAQRLAGGTPVGNTASTATSSASSVPMIQVQSSDGKIWNIPENKLNAALARDKGAKRVS